jgi:hypothetical protein
MFPSGDTKELDLEAMLDIQKLLRSWRGIFAFFFKKQGRASA